MEIPVLFSRSSKTPTASNKKSDEEQVMKEEFDTLEDPLQENEEDLRESDFYDPNAETHFSEKKESKKDRSSSNVNSTNNKKTLMETFSGYPWWVKAMIIITFIGIITMINDALKPSKKTGADTIAMNNEAPVTQESVAAEDNATSMSLKTKKLESCLIGTNLDFTITSTGLKVTYGGQDISAGATFCDEFQITKADMAQSTNGPEFVIEVSSGAQKIITKNISMTDSLRPEYYLEGIEVNDQLHPGQRKTCAVGDSIADGLILSGITPSKDGMNVEYAFTYKNTVFKTTVPRSMVL